MASYVNLCLGLRRWGMEHLGEKVMIWLNIGWPASRNLIQVEWVSQLDTLFTKAQPITFTLANKKSAKVIENATVCRPQCVNGVFARYLVWVNPSEFYPLMIDCLFTSFLYSRLLLQIAQNWLSLSFFVWYQVVFFFGTKGRINFRVSFTHTIRNLPIWTSDTPTQGLLIHSFVGRHASCQSQRWF